MIDTAATIMGLDSPQVQQGSNSAAPSSAYTEGISWHGGARAESSRSRAPGTGSQRSSLTAAVVRRRFRELSVLVHPDKCNHPDAEEVSTSSAGPLAHCLA